jgi:succinate dehydrogenase/fumarate reductase-like Fe-S protein
MGREAGAGDEERTVRFRIHRSSPAGTRVFDVPFHEGMSVMDGLDFVYEHLDGSLAYYDHAACNQGICRRCLASINGEVGLLCQTLVARGSEIEVAPLPSQRVERDLVTGRGKDDDGQPSA